MRGVSSNIGMHASRAEAASLWLLGAFAAILLSYVWFLLLDAHTAQRLADEDGIVEYLGAVFSLLAACLFLLSYLRSDGEANSFFGVTTKRNIWFLGLAFLMFVAFGEEISWGQRIFGWNTPELLGELNAQGETNLHNLWLMQATNPDGSHKSSLELLLNANRLYSMFWLAYCVALPLLVGSSDFARRWARFLGVPVPALIVGGLFVANYFIFQAIVAFGGLDRAAVQALDELKETNYAFAFVVLGLRFLADMAESVPRGALAPSR